MVPPSVWNPCLPSWLASVCCPLFKCCACSCSGTACGYSSFECLDPEADDELYECEAPPPASLPCSAEVQREWVVDEAAKAQALTAAVNCSGGSFEVDWRGTVVVDEPIYVSDGTVLTIRGEPGSMASIYGSSSTRLFTVVNAALHLDGLNVSYGASMAGGAIAATGSTLTFNRTNFVGNAAVSLGGAVFVSDASSVSCADGTTFIENGAGNEGGAMFASGGSEVSCGGRWLRNSAGARGGALLLVNESSASWSEESIFEFNTAGLVGGALSLESSSSVSWDAPTGFYYNNAGVYGGALTLHDWSSVSWQAGTIFDSNSAGDRGGALFVHENSHVSWSGDGNTVFDGNQAVQQGGALAVEDDSQASWTVGTTTTFFGNSALDGGAIRVVRSSLNVYGAYSLEAIAAIGHSQLVNSTGNQQYVPDTRFGGALNQLDASAASNGPVTFTGNRAEYSGGAVTIYESNVSWNAPITTVLNNTAAFGGAIAIFNSSVTWNGQATMTFNSASEWGGAMYIFESSVSWVGQANFSNNTAKSSGGALHVRINSSLTFDGDATFAENDVGPDESYPGGGGAVAVALNSSVVWRGGMIQFVGNVASAGSALYLAIGSHASWNGPTAKFVNNSAQIWGTLLLDRESEVFWSGKTLFEGNTAESGGAIVPNDGSYVGWTGETTFSSNAATIDGGAVASPESDPRLNPRNSTLHISGTTTFVNNTSGANGGGLSLHGACALEVNPSVEVSFVGNSAGVAGGAVFVSSAGTGPTFSSALFVSNSAQVGGAISLFGSGNSKSVSEAEPPDPTTFDRCRFVGNRAATGGAIDSAAGYDSIFDSTFEDNAARTGGAMRLAGTASIDGCSFVENFSDAGEGAVVSNIGTISWMSNITFSGNVFNCPAGTFLDYNAVSCCLQCSWAINKIPSAWLTYACFFRGAQHWYVCRYPSFFSAFQVRDSWVVYDVTLHHLC